MKRMRTWMLSTRLDVATTEDPLVCREEESVQTGYVRELDMCRGEEKRMDQRGGGNEREMGYEEEQNWVSAVKQEVEQEELERWLHELMCCGALELTVQRSGIRDALQSWSASVNGWCRAHAGEGEAITGQREETDSDQVVVGENMRARMELNRNGQWLRLQRSNGKQEEQKEDQKEEQKEEVDWMERGRVWLEQNSTYRDSSAGKRCADGTVRKLGWLQEQKLRWSRTGTETETGTEEQDGKKGGGRAPSALHRNGLRMRLRRAEEVWEHRLKSGIG
jgi:hypothetical protein